MYGKHFGIRKLLGFGAMRLPMKDGNVDIDAFKEMVDLFFERGFNYVDTAHVYLDGHSEEAVGEAVSKRYPRDSFVLTTKLSDNLWHKKEDIRPLFETQLADCKVDYFDIYLMHAQDRNKNEKYTKNGAYEVVKELKAEGKIKHIGISFHDKAEVLDAILNQHPEIEVVQIQFNYLDYDDAGIESKKVYDVCVKHNKPVIVMEPVKGGTLANLPSDCKKVFEELGDASPASYAIRFAASYPQVMMVLSGMGNMDMVEDNTAYMENFVPLSEKEMEAVAKVRAIYRGKDLIQCTKCRYCLEVCPKQIQIPDLFALLNTKKQLDDWNSTYYHSIITSTSAKASECLKCGLCEKACPQHLPIRKLLEEVASTFEGQPVED